ncbi:MAG: addiction module antidote protein [Pseudomonadota bacterium]
MAEKFTRYDSAEHLKTDEDMAAYLDACLEEAGDDPAYIAHALGVIARARGMTQLARDTGLARENLYKALSADGNPEFGTILKVVKALGLQLHVQTSKAM